MQHCNPDRLKEIINWLAVDIGPRPRTRPDLLNLVRNHLQKYFDLLGYRPVSQPVIWNETTFYNVVAIPEGETLAKSPVPLLVIGAHYDTVSQTPGADDNGSGVAALMELARILAPKPPPGLRLVAFCLEEPPVFRTKQMGSYVFAQSLKKQRAAVQGMICLEMVGYFNDDNGSQSYPLPFMNRIYPRAGNFIALVGNLNSWRLASRVKKGFELGCDLPLARLNGPSFVYGIDFSDHWSFNRHGYQAVMLTDTAFYRNPNYHRPTDLPGTLDYKRCAAVVNGLATAVVYLTERAD